MKKFIRSVLAIVLILTMTVPVFAERKGKTKEPNPNKPISRKDFNSSLASLLEEYGYSWENSKGKDSITREEMVMILGKLLIDEEIIDVGSIELPFKDIKNISKNTKVKLTALLKQGIIDGKTKHTFNPNSKITYGEFKVILERIKKLLEWKEDERNKDIIPFKAKNVVDSRQGSEGIVYKKGKDKVVVSITKKFNTPGYNMEINEIRRVDSRYEIDLAIIPPDRNADLPQVVTYLTANIEIDKKYLGKEPYRFYTKEIEKDLEIMREIPYKQLKVEQTYNGKEGIAVKEGKDKVSLLITQEFSTPGYAMAIEKILYKDGQYEVGLIIAPPKKSTILPQVITYKTIHIEIHKNDMIKDPYKFHWKVLPVEL